MELTKLRRTSFLQRNWQNSRRHISCIFKKISSFSFCINGEQFGIVVKASRQKRRDCEFYSCLRYEVNWVTLCQSFFSSQEPVSKNLAKKAAGTFSVVARNKRKKTKHLIQRHPKTNMKTFANQNKFTEILWKDEILILEVYR